MFKLIDNQVPENTDLLVYNEEWINEDDNPEGIRIGFFNGDQWASAGWCIEHGEYHTITDLPTHYSLLPKSPRYEQQGENNGQGDQKYQGSTVS